MEIDHLTRDFRQKRAAYDAFTSSLESLLRNLISATGIEPFAYEGRTKSISSFDEKVQRDDKAGKYLTIDDMTDLSGVRVICYLQEDCDAVCTMIENQFDVDLDNSIVKHDELDPDKFGYLSTHFVVSLNENRADLIEFQAFKGLKAEIQVRTLLQHTWAAIDWKFRYKEEKEAPKQLRRRLFRISALLEAADNEFSQVKVELDTLRERYTKSLAAGELNIATNTESIDSYLLESNIVKTIIVSAKKAGLKILQAPREQAVLKLAATAESLGLKTIADLNNELTRLAPNTEEFYRFLVSVMEPNRNGNPVQLILPAVLRYLLLGYAPSGKRQLIAKQQRLAMGFGDAMSSFDRHRKERA